MREELFWNGNFQTSIHRKLAMYLDREESVTFLFKISEWLDESISTNTKPLSTDSHLTELQNKGVFIVYVMGLSISVIT